MSRNVPHLVTATGVVGLGLVVVGGAWAQQPAPKVIEIPVPQEEPMPGEPGSLDGTAPAPVPVIEVPVEPASGSRYRTPIRREQRQATGTPPTTISGKWSVVQVTDLGTTEDFRIKMERAGKALDQSCILTGLLFDFGPPTGQGFPGQIVLTQEQDCDKGGLGRYVNAIAMTVAPGWSGEGGVTLTLPEARGSAAMIRLRVADQAGRTPSQWVGPETELERNKSSYTLLAEYPKAGRNVDASVPSALHLTEPSGRVFHLEPIQ